MQLATASKLFCGCSTQFGAEPNTQTCPVCIGMPGTLPVMNREAFQLALKTAVALELRDSRVHQVGPQAVLLSRPAEGLSDQPVRPADVAARLSGDQRSEGRVRAEAGSHPAAPTWKKTPARVCTTKSPARRDSRIDLNRTGTPLLEIVTEPDMRSSAEAKAFLNELKLLLTYLGVSDCNMQEGSLRVDANVNLHIDTPQGKVATPIVEIKNMNSFRAVERALDYEAAAAMAACGRKRSQQLGDAPKQTRGWDDAAGVTRGQRSKEESSDYRYFPDPDLVPVTVRRTKSTKFAQSLGELPAALRQRLETEFGLSAYDADVLVNQGRPVVDYFLDVAEATRRRQGGRQLGHAGCAADAQGARHRQLTRCRSRSAALADLITQSQVGRSSQPAGTRSVSGDGRQAASTPRRR